MTITYKYKLRPNDLQQNQLSQAMGCARYVYNWGLGFKINTYKEQKKSLSYVDLAKMLTILKKTEGHLWLNDVANVVLQQSLRNMDSSFQNFFRKKKGFPKFKSKKRNEDSAKFINNVGFDFEKWAVKLPKIGWVSICRNRKFDVSKVRLGTLTVKKDNLGTYWCTIVVHDGRNLPTKAKLEKSKAVGIDVGVKDLLILSDGTKAENPKFLETFEKRIKYHQRRLSKKQKGSNRREKQRLYVAKLHQKVRNKRNDYLHKLTTRLMKSKYTTFVLEDLNIQGMEQNHHLARSIQSASWGELKRQMCYKSDWCGKNVVFIGRFEPSSKTCSKCEYKNDKLKLSDREWECPNCNSILDRDINAAINILNIGFREKSKSKSPQGSGSKDGEVPR